MSQRKINETTEFDFIINCIWSHIVGCLDLSLNVIFSPADPDIFHRHFTTSFEFLGRFELRCAAYDKEFKRKLVNSHSYKFFVKKWPILIYFQIRFQEIVTKLEEELLDYGKLTSVGGGRDEEDEQTSTFRLNVSECLVSQLEYCWLESTCFLKCLLGLFWKLNLQLISRYCHFFIELFQNKVHALASSSSENSLNSQVMQQLSLNTDLTSSSLSSSRPRTPTDDLMASNPQRPVVNMNGEKQLPNDLDLSIMVLTDAHKLQSIKVGLFIKYLYSYK